MKNYSQMMFLTVILLKIITFILEIHSCFSCSIYCKVMKRKSLKIKCFKGII